MRLLLVTSLGLATHDETVGRAATVLRATDPRRVVFGVRDHGASSVTRAALARSLIALARPHGARVVVHDRVDLALAVVADGVQLGERSIDVRDARALLGAAAWIGRSCHDAAGLRAAAAEGADAVTLSPLFASPGKGEPIGLDRFRELRATVPALTVFALGGILATNARDALSAGADGVAAMRAWLVDDPRELARAVLG